MPSGGIRVDENTLGFAKEADEFLAIATSGCSTRDIPIFWRELSCDPERVQSFVVCLIVKLIALDSGQGMMTLSKNYCEICGLDVDVNNIKAWMTKEKALNQERKHLSLLMQHQIISTLYFLKQFYPHMPSNHLKNIHIRWNLARNCVKSDYPQRCDAFEIAVLRDYYRFGKEVPKVINPTEINSESNLLVEVLEACYKHHRRGQLGYLPSRHGKLCNYRDVADSLSYFRLQFMVSGDQNNVNSAINKLMIILKKYSTDTADYGEKEILLPVLHILHQLVIEGVSYSTMNVYRAVQPFYLWPLPHSEVVKTLLDTIQSEDFMRGSAFRETLIAEHHLEFSINCSSPAYSKEHHYHLMVENHAPRGYAFSQAFEKQNTTDPISLKKLFLRNLFYSLLKTVDLTKLDEQLEGMTDQLDRLCEQALNILVSAESDESNQTNIDTRMDHVVMDINHLYGEIMSHKPAFPVPEHVKLTPQQLEDFSLPAPYFHSHPIAKINSEVLKEKLREVIDSVYGRAHRSKKLSGRRHAPVRTPSRDSGTVDPEIVSSPDDMLLTRPYNSLRPGSAPSSKVRSLSDTDMAPGTYSHPTSPLRPCASPSSGGSVTFSNSHNELSDTIGGETESSSSNGRSTSRSPDSSSGTDSSPIVGDGCMRSYSPASSDSGSLYSATTINSLRRGSLAVYGSGNMVGSSNRKMSVQYIEGSTGSMVRMKKGGAHTLRVRRKSRSSSQSAAVVTKIVKVVLVGNDELINNMAYAYADLRIKEPSLFNGLKMLFYYVPMSEVSTATTASLNERRPSDSSADNLIQPLVNALQPALFGEDVWLGCFVSNKDSWYERNVMLATHNLLRIIPSVIIHELLGAHWLLISRTTFKGYRDHTLVGNNPEKATLLSLPPGNTSIPIASLPNVSEKLPPSPAELIRSLVTNYCREAHNTVHFNMYSVELEVKPDKSKSSHPQSVRKCYMLQRLDIQKYRKGKQVKTFEANMTMEEVTLDCSTLQQRNVSLKNVWSVGVASVPRVYDLCVTNPEHDNVELTVTQAVTEGRVTTTHKLSEENSYHVKHLEIEMSKDKPVSVMIDSDASNIVDNVIRIKVQPAMAGDTEANFLSSVSVYEQHQAQKQVFFPVMSFWPVDL